MILTISIGLILELITSYFLDVLPFNNNSKTICDCIYLLLSLNQLQDLIVEGILKYAIKNKGKMYFNLDQQLLIYIKDEKRVRKN